MARRLDIQALGLECRSEAPHAAHVARLALRLFDALRAPLGLPAADRGLLEAAALLHEIGFALDRRDHAAAGAAAIRAEGLSGFTPAARAAIAAAVACHAAPASAPAPAAGRRALRLAALLRVADALDHAHVQDTVIREVAVDGDGVRLSVASAAYGGVRARAEARADLFRHAFRRELRVEGSGPEPGRPLLDGVLSPDTATVEAARLILALQVRILRDNAACALAGDDPEYLHDLRVAARRARFALRFFRDPLDGTSAADCERQLADFCRRTGAARDAQVWLDFVRRCAGGPVAAASPGWAPFLAAVERDARRQTVGLRRLLRSAAFERLRRDLAYLLRVELPERAGLDRTRFAAYAARRVYKVYRRLQHTDLDARTAPAEDLHELRKVCRVERYRTEFAAAVLGPAVRKLVGNLRALTSTLGTVHDMDVRLGPRGRGPKGCPAALVAVLQDTRAEALEGFRRAWAKLHQRKRRTAVIRELRAASAADRHGHGFGDW